MTKRTLSHRLPNGTIATRTTSADYSHVVVSRLVDVDGYRAAELAWARRWFRDFDDAAQRIAIHAAKLESSIAAAQSWGVVSWHTGFAAANKAAGASARRASVNGREFFAYAVEAVNNGAE